MISKLIKKVKKLKFSNSQILLFIFILALLIMVGIALFDHPSGDSTWYLAVTRFIARNNRLPVVEHLGRDGFSRPPLFPIIGAIFYKIGFLISQNEHFATEFTRMVNPIIGSLNILVVYFIGKKLFSNKVGILSALFMCFFPLHLGYSVRSHMDITAAFFISLTMLSLIHKKPFLTGIFFGLSMFSKYYGILTILPILVFLWSSKLNLKTKIKHLSIILIISFSIALPFFIRNYLIWGNPVWPFLNNLFKGVPAIASKNLHRFSFAGFFPLSGLLFVVFYNFFGIPVDARVGFANLSHIPMLMPIIIIWSIVMLIFIAPFFVELIKFISKRDKKISFLIIWMVAFIIYILITLAYSEVPLEFQDRFFLPALPAFAILWTRGFERILKSKIGRIKIWLYLLLILILITFPVQIFGKTIYHRNLWRNYDTHLQWVKNNTDKEAMILVNNPCYSYLLDRKTPISKPDSTDFYVIYNDDFYLCAHYPEPYKGVNISDKNYKLIYHNKDPDFRVYFFNSTLNTN